MGINDSEFISSLTEFYVIFRDKVDELQSTFPCKQCMSKAQNVAFNCGHVLCHECSKTVKECPMCREPIASRLNLYYA